MSHLNRIPTLLALILLTGCSSGDAPAPMVSPTPEKPPAVEAAVPPSPQAPPPAIEVQSEPAGASVFINGRLVGATPLRLTYLAPGTYSLRMERQGCAPYQCPLTVNEMGRIIRESLQPEATGALAVDVEPKGAEVLLNGELVGLTPLSLEKVPTGVHEMIVRKTNFRPYTAVVRIQAGQTARFADRDPEHRLLKDLILDMLNALIQSEPQRASHYLDKGHYLFINNRMDEAADAFASAEEISMQPPVLPEGMTGDERAAELRLFVEDQKRVSRELERHRTPRSFDFATVRDFNLAFEKAKQRRLMEHVGSWDWVLSKGQSLVGQAQYLQATQLYEAHLKKAGDGESVVPCLIELMKIRLTLRDLSSFRALFDDFCRRAAGHPDQLLSITRAVLPYTDRLRSTQRPEFLDLLAVPLQAALEQAAAPWKGECYAELGHLLMLQGRAPDAVPFLEAAVNEPATDEQRDERILQLAEALRIARRTDDARAWFQRLADSPRESIRRRALAGLILVGAGNR